MCYNLLGQVKSAISIKHTRECNVISNPPSPSQTLPNPNSPRKSTNYLYEKKNEANTLWKHPAPADKHEDRLFLDGCKTLHLPSKIDVALLHLHKIKRWENMEKQMTFEATRDTRFAGICNIM